MPPLIEKDSPLPVIIGLAVIFLIFLGAGLELAYMGGVFTGKNEVIENDQRIAKQNLLNSAPPSAPDSTKP